VQPNDIAGQAALTICESLLLSLSERNILPAEEINGILEDVAASHEFVPDDDQAEKNAAIASLIHSILNSRKIPPSR